METIQGKIIRQKLLFRMKAVNETDYTISGVFSTGGQDRQGETIDQNGWKLDEYMQNPVVLFAHDHYQPAVGRVIELAKDGNGNLVGTIQFAAKEYDFAMTLFNLYKGGFMKAFSVGFINDKYEIDQENDTVTLLVNTLYELSCVNVPANAMALAYSKGIDISPIQRVMKEIRSIEKGVVPYHDFGNADEGTEWDGPAEEQACGDDIEKLKKICAWFDESNADMKASYKLPHHQTDGLKAVWRGVAAAMAALLGGRGGVDMPETDSKGVYNHLSSHYKDFGKETPEFKEYSEEEIGIIEMHGHPKYATIQEKKAVEVISKSNQETIRSAIRTLTEVLKAGTEADNKVVTEGRIPLKEGGNKKIPVSIINRAIRELWKIKNSQ